MNRISLLAAMLLGALLFALLAGAGPAAAQQQAAPSPHERAKASRQARTSQRPAVTGRRVPCAQGEAAGYDCYNVDLLSFLPIAEIGGAPTTRLNDIWGWTDPQTSVDYALVGRTDGTAFVDISDPANPVYVGEVPLTEGAHASAWRDIKTYAGHAFIVADGAGEHGMQVFDLTRLREVEGEPITFEPDVVYDNIHSAHNLVINTESGYAYAVGGGGGGTTCGGGLHMIDIQNPTSPTFAGCFADASTGRRGTGYTHDAQCVIYEGPDEAYQGREICFGLNETALSIADVTDKANPVALSVAGYPSTGYTHQGWLTPDHRYLFANDELDEISGQVEQTRTLIWDVADLDDPQLVKQYTYGTTSSDHNLYIEDGLMYQTNYGSGLRIHDISDPANPVQIGFFDTTPGGANEAGFYGTWSNYPFFESGVVAVSSIGEGLFLLEAGPPLPEVPGGYALSGVFPNPSSPGGPPLTVELAVDEAQHVRIAVYDVLGRRVALVHDEWLTARVEHSFSLGAPAWPSGTYFLRVTGETFAETRSFVRVR